MKINKWMLLGATAAAITAVTVWAAVSTRTFRTTAGFGRVSQVTDNNGKPKYNLGGGAGHDLVNLALAADFDCDPATPGLVTAIRLVVFDRTGHSNIVTIASSTSLDIVLQQDDDTK